jgi:NAD(P)H dehydrogenase (quinone)
MATKVLSTGATGDTGRAVVEATIDSGRDTRARVHQKDARLAFLEKREGALGDHLESGAVRAAMEGADAAYFVRPVAPGVIHATPNFAQAAKESGVTTVINQSQRSANRVSGGDR